MCIEHREGAFVARVQSARGWNLLHSPGGLMNSPVVILGAGLCGLSAAYHLNGKSDYVILERNSRSGGLARTETYGGFSFDHSIHILYSRDPYATDLICNRLL